MIVVVNRQNKELFDAIRKLASVEKGLITQVVIARYILDGKKASVKIALQIAARVGLQVWQADIPFKKTMICGYDSRRYTAQRDRH